jgi:hypothetical protein
VHVCCAHKRQVHLEELEKSLVAEYSIKTGHSIDFSCTSLLDRKAGYVGYPMKEPMEIQLSINNFNRDSGFILSQD